jgi:hypothetical protein
MLQGVADYKKGWLNDTRNINDIQSGIDAINRGGTLGVVDYNPPPLNPICK